MGVRKHNMAERLKEERKQVAYAKLTNVPSSPRKMRLVADMVRGMEVYRALGVLQFSNKSAAKDLYKCLKSALANWQAKNEDEPVDNDMLYISTIYVNPAPMLKRLRPAPQGRAYRIRKRANHVTLIVDRIENKNNKKSK